MEAFRIGRDKAKRASRLTLDGTEGEHIKAHLKGLVNRFEHLKSRCTEHSDKLYDMAARQKEFTEGTTKLLSWLSSAEEQLGEATTEPSTSDTTVLNQQLDRMKSLGMEAIAHSSHIEELQRKAKGIREALQEIGAEPAQLEEIDSIIKDISKRYETINESSSNKAHALQVALVKTQDVNAAMNDLASWLKDTDTTLNNARPISLQRDNLLEQVHEVRILEADVESHKPGIDSIKHKAIELMQTCELEMAKSVESRLNELDTTFQAVEGKCKDRTADVDDVFEKLSSFQEDLRDCNEWLVSHIETLESQDLTRLDNDTFQQRVTQIQKDKELHMGELEELKQLGSQLVQDSRTGDVSAVKDSLSDLERNWAEFESRLGEREKEASQRERQGTDFEAARAEVLEWLTSKEGQMDSLEPVAVEVEIIGQQIEELQVCCSYDMILFSEISLLELMGLSEYIPENEM